MSAGEALVPLDAAARPHFSWLEAGYLKKVVAALDAAEADCARFVGGCVRDSLLGAAPKDFDIATTLTPEAASAALKTAGLGVAPTGIDHGTVTAIVDHKGVEVTTLRADVSTDGRRATVAFSRDWAVDAGRRDFTVNAIYLTPGGMLYDPVGGVDDACARRVRFIGEPDARIREDFLRILRFFRFSARFCESFDAAGLAACERLKDGIAQLSAERIGAEITGILVLLRAVFALEAMAKTGVLAKVWAASPDLEAAARVKSLEAHASAPLMLAALWGEEGDGIGRALRLSNAEKAVRSSALRGAAAIAPDMPDKTVRERIYRFGKDTFADAILLAAANTAIGEVEYRRLKKLADDWLAPVFSISGRHVLEAGVPAGPDISAILTAAEAQWVEEDFPVGLRQREILRSVIESRGR